MGMKYNLLAIFCMAGVTACASTEPGNRNSMSKQSATSLIHSVHQTHLEAALREMDPVDDGRPPEPVLSAADIPPAADDTTQAHNTQTSPEAMPEPEIPAESKTAQRLAKEPLPIKDAAKPSKPDIDNGPIRTGEGQLILGSEEWVYIPGINLTLAASINSDDARSALSVNNYQTFKRNGEEWVKFRVEHTEIISGEVSLPVLRWVKLDQTEVLRPEVDSWIELGEVKEKLNLVLTDLSDSPFPARIGTNFYRSFAVQDPNRRFVQPKVEK